MLLFKRILNFTRAKVDDSEQRGAERYLVGANVQFTATVRLARHDERGRPDARGRQGPELAAKVINLSTLGASVQLPAEAVAHHGENCLFKLSVEDYRLEIPGKVAYFRSYPAQTACGVAFAFEFFEVRKAYLQLLEAVATGASLLPVKANEIKPDATGLDKEVYRGKDNAQLSVWRAGADGEIQRFDFQMNEYGVRWSLGQDELETYATNGPKAGNRKPARAPDETLTRTEHEEVSWLFCLAVPNLAKAVQADVRKFLATLVA
jgi:hypothetical protein